MRSSAIIVCLALVTTMANAQPRPYTPELSCAAVRGIVARQGAVVLATSPNAYERVFLDSGACQGEVTSAPAFEPTLDDPNCFAGYRCKQRNNDGTGTK
ncbi:hypothetical protein [Methylobacterium haplocladii]|nr:hypothetical protein [Methylobacterium haplocladii]